MKTGWRRRSVGAMAAALLPPALLVVGTPMSAGAVEPTSIAFEFGNVSTDGYGWGVQIADVTGDTLADLIVTTHSSSNPERVYRVLVFAQQLDGSLASSPAVYDPSVAPLGNDTLLFPATGDLDDDGDIDLVVGHEDGLDVFYQAAGVFGSPTTFATPTPVHGVEVADLNADGRDDIAYSLVDATNGYRYVRRFQLADNTIAPGFTHIAYGAAETFVIGDVNADGFPDVVLEDPSASDVPVLFNNGVSPFSFALTPEDRVGAATSIAVADVTNDNRKDLIVANETSLSLLAGEDGGTLADPVVVGAMAGYVNAVEVADVNGDARTDVVIFDAGATRVFLQDDVGGLTGVCGFGSVVASPPYGGRETVAVGDLTGDGLPDAAGAHEDVFVHTITQLVAGTEVASTTRISAGPRTVRIGDAAVYSGFIERPAGTCSLDGSVSIERENPNGSTTALGTAPLEFTGGTHATFSFEDTPPALGEIAYRATWGGDEFHAPSTSPARTATVAKRLSSLNLGLSDGQIFAGQSSTLVATLTGGDRPVNISFFKVVDGNRTKVGTASTGTGDQARLTVSPNVTTHYLATYAGTATTEPDESQTVALKVVKRTSSLDLAAPRTVDFGDGARLTATLHGGSGVRTIAFYAVTSAGGRKLLGNDAADAAGIAIFDVRPAKNTTYVAVYAGNSLWKASESDPRTMTVRVRTTGAMVHYSYRRNGVAVFDCCRAYLAFEVAPNHAGLRMRVESQYLSASGWRSFDGSVSYFRLRANSTQEIYTDISGGEDFKFRIRACAPSHVDHAGSCSTWSEFRFQ